MTEAMENRFNLVDEAWIPVVDIGRVSLRQIFSTPTYTDIGGTPIEKIALFKLLLSIAQAANTPEDETAWKAMDDAGLASRCLGYLDKWHSKFYLYGDNPFLQMPAIATAIDAVERNKSADKKTISYGKVMPEVATANTTLLSQIQVYRPIDDAAKAVLLVCLMSFALGSKSWHNKVTLTPGYVKKLTSKPGPAVSRGGLLHNFCQCASLQRTLWLNLWTRKDINKSMMFDGGIGRPPWEQMPAGEDCDVAKSLKASLQGRLVPLSRFCLLRESNFYYSGGVIYPDYDAGVIDTTAAIDRSGGNKMLWVNPEKRPWRELTALLSFISNAQTSGYECPQLRMSLERARSVESRFTIWSGGIKVRSNAGEQYLSGRDDFVVSVVALDSAALGAMWFSQLEQELGALNGMGKDLSFGVKKFFADSSMGQKLAGRATQFFWQLCERDFQQLVDNCGTDADSQQARDEHRKRFARYVHQAYDHVCPKDTARQIDAWAECRPNMSKYLTSQE